MGSFRTAHTTTHTHLATGAVAAMSVIIFRSTFDCTCDRSAGLVVDDAIAGENVARIYGRYESLPGSSDQPVDRLA